MSNALLNIVGTLKVKILITRKNERPKTITGSASSSSMRSDFSEIYQRVIQDTIAQYQYSTDNKNIQDSATLQRQTQDGTYMYEVIDYNIDYSTAERFYKIKRVSRRDKRTGKNKYYTEARDKETGKVKSRVLWSNKYLL